MEKFFIILVLVSLSDLINVQSQPQWIQQTNPAMGNSQLTGAWAVNSQICWMCGTDKQVIKTTNGGTNWISAGNTIPLTTSLNCIFAFDANKAFTGSYDGMIFKTTNGGNNWAIVNLSPPSPFIDAIHFFDANNGFILGDGNMSSGKWIFQITTNGGSTWALGQNAPVSATGEFGFPNSYCAFDTGHIWWGTNMSKIWKGSFRGQFNSYQTPGSQNSLAVWFNFDSTGDACFLSGPIKISKNGGLTWTNGTFTPPQTPRGLKGISNTNYMWLCGGFNSGFISRSTDNGTTFILQLTVSSNALCITMANINCGWSGTSTGNIYKYIDNVGIPYQNEIPFLFELGQNYPNPFNPQTTIDFSLAQTGYISLKIYNLLGQEVMTLIDGVETAGPHSVFFNASNLPSGVYFYTMKSGDFTDTKSLMLVK